MPASPPVPSVRFPGQAGGWRAPRPLAGGGRPLRPSAAVLAAVLAWPLVCPGGLTPRAAAQERSLLSAEERSKLDTFEGITLDKADKIFAEKDYRRALAEYDSFILQFPDSKATPYAILRKGRSLQLLEKRFEAIKVYQEVLDFFPNDVKYAAAALYAIGECHAQSGDVEKAVKSWLALADDADYAKEPPGASALNQLADNFLKQGKADEGIKRYEQVAVTFRKTNPDAARHAIAMVVPHHVRTKPDLGRLRSFYEAVGTFEHAPREPGKDVAQDGPFWQRIRDAIKDLDKFTDVQKGERESFFRYWAGQMQGKMPDDDAFQIDLANFQRNADGNDAAWAQRLDKQFADRQKEGDYGRVVRWIGAFATDKKKADEYYQKLDFGKMANADIVALVYTLTESNRDAALAKNTFDKIRFGEMADPAKLEICNWMQRNWQLPGTRDLAVQACLAFSDQNAGKMHALRYLHWRANPHHGHVHTKADIPEGLVLATELQNVPQFAKDAFSLGGNLLQWSAKYEDAIKAYRQADNPPQTLFWTAECLAKLGRLDPAVAQLREVENFFKDHAAEASLRIAYLYRDAGIKEKYVRSLRGVLKKYPRSGQSSEAHQRLEEMGLPIGGGVDADDT